MRMNHLPKRFFTMLMIAFMGIGVMSCSDDDDTSPTPTPDPDPDPVESSEANITSFVFAELDPSVTATIDGTNIMAELPTGTDVTALSPTIEVSDEATVAPASGEAQDFSEPVTYTVTAEDGTTQEYTVTVSVPALRVEAVWQRSLNEGGLPDWFTANNDRDIAVFGEYVYVHNNNDKIRVLNSSTGADISVGELGYLSGTQNFQSGNLFLLGTATDSEGRIVASNLRQGDAGMNPWNVYVWENNDADQELLFSFPTPEGYRLGENLSVVGDVRGDAIVYVPGSGFGVESNEVLKFTITGGEVNPEPEMIALSGISNMGNAPDVAPVSSANDANLIVAGTGIANIAEYDQSGNLVGQLPAELADDEELAMLFLFALDVAPFEVNGRKMVATTATDFTSNAADSGYLYLIDYTDGWDNITANNITRMPFTPDGNIDANFNGTGGVDVLVNGNEATVYAMITNFGVSAFSVTFE